MNRKKLADFILQKIELNKHVIKEQFDATKAQIGYFWIDDLLPTEIVCKISDEFPEKEEMVLKKSLKEDKYRAVQMNKYHPMLEEVIYAFQDERIVIFISVFFYIFYSIPDASL